MKAKRIEFILPLLVSVLSAAAGAADFAGGTGEPNDPYLIATAEQFLTADFNAPGTYFQLCNDIDMERRDVVLPDSFRAHLDGAGFEIQNAICPWGSFFGVIESEASISNLVLANVDVVRAVRPDYPGSILPVGALALANGGTITNCGVTGVVATWRVGEVGGFVGFNNGAIVNCYFDGWVMAPWEDLFEDDEWVLACVGGLVGGNGDDGLIANSLARATVLGNRGVGGLVGLNRGTIRNCYARGPVLGQVGAGGLVSENTGHLQTCYAASLVTGEMRGGLVGLAGGERLGSVSNCVWDWTDTDCDWSGAGIGLHDVGRGAVTPLASNGWSEDPNWMIPTEPDLSGPYPEYYPRLAWEGVDGTMVPRLNRRVFEEGSGTENDPYVIRTRGDLADLYRASIYWDKHFILGNDVDASGGGPPPIGICAGSSFSGTFDGNGHVIRNLHWSPRDGTTPMWNGGLFGYVTGEIRNLTLENCKITGGVNSRRIGLLAGSNYGVIKNCSVTGSITVGEYSQFIGGLIGASYHSIGEVSSCQATVTIQAGEGSTEVGELMGGEDYPRALFLLWEKDTM